MVGRGPLSERRRRYGFARRDSNLALLGAMATGLVIALAVLLLLVQRINPEFGMQLRGAMLDALQPLSSVARAPATAVRHVSEAVDAHWRVVEENRRLKDELSQRRAEVARTQLLQAEVKRLEGLLQLRRPERRLVVSTVASSSSTTAQTRTAIIGAGFQEGVRPRMPVIAAEGLAGRVTDVGEHAARILLLSDPSSRVPVKVVRTGWTGLAMGNGGTLLSFSFDLASGTDEIKLGDRLVTSGDGGLYPPGIPVAVIVDVRPSAPRARPLANPSSLGPVSVEAPWLPRPKLVPAENAPSEPDLPVQFEQAASPASVNGTAERPTAP